MKKFSNFALAFFLILLVGFGTSRVSAETATIDFETYALGTVHGQDGWSSSGAAGSGCAVYDHEIADPTTFGNSVFGTRSLRMSNAVTSGCFGDQTFSKSLVDEAGETSAVNDGLSGGTRQSYFEAEWEFASTVPGSEQAGLSVVASPDRGDGARMSWVQMADTPGGLEVNFYDYQESADVAVCGNDFVFTNLVSGLDRTAVHTIKIQMYFVDGAANDVVLVWVDGVLEHTGTSWEDYFRNCENNPTRPVDSILFRTGGTAAPATAGDGFLIDNLTLFSGSVTQCTTTCYVDGANGNDAFGGNVGDPKKTIQAAINQVDAGGTVIVLPGTYNESPNITKSLTLESSGGRDVTTIQLQSGPTYLGALTIDGADVTVDGFTVLGFDGTVSTLASTNIYVTNTPDNVNLTNNRLKVGEIDTGSSNGDDGFGLITTYNTSNDVNTLVVTGNIFEPLNAAGTRAFYINPGVNQFTFANNQISGKFLRTAITQAKDGLVEENTVTGTGPAASRSAGLGTWGYPDPTIYGITTFRNNSISGVFKGVAVFETESVIVQNNTFSNNDYGVWVGPSAALTFDISTLHINLNSITSSHFNGIERDATLSGTLDGEKNWWGDASGPSGAGPGSGDSVSGNVDFTPWLCDGTDTSAAIGFQPNASTLCGVATKLVFSTQPGNGVAGSPLSTQPVVTAVDNDGNPDPNFNGAVTLTINNNPGGGTLGGTTTVNAVNGVATFTNVSIDQPGMGYTLDANSPGLTGTTSAPFNVTAPGPAPAACLAYGVQDSSSADSQFFTLDPATKITTNIGPLYKKWDFESLDIDPTTGLIYAATSSSNAFGKKGYLYQVDGVNGSLFLVGNTGQRNIEALAFHPSDGTLWGWAADKGIVTINKTTGAATLVKRSDKDVKGMAWNNAGTLLYLTEGKTLYSYNPSNGKFTTITKSLPGNVEGLDMRPDGLLVLGVDGKKTLYAYNPVTKKLISSQNITGLPYNDIEGISWPVCAP
jgi:hypothetical protein